MAIMTSTIMQYFPLEKLKELKMCNNGNSDNEVKILTHSNAELLHKLNTQENINKIAIVDFIDGHALSNTILGNNLSHYINETSKPHLLNDDMFYSTNVNFKTLSALDIQSQENNDYLSLIADVIHVFAPDMKTYLSNGGNIQIFEQVLKTRIIYLLRLAKSLNITHLIFYDSFLIIENHTLFTTIFNMTEFKYWFKEIHIFNKPINNHNNKICQTKLDLEIQYDINEINMDEIDTIDFQYR